MCVFYVSNFRIMKDSERILGKFWSSDPHTLLSWVFVCLFIYLTSCFILFS